MDFDCGRKSSQADNYIHEKTRIGFSRHFYCCCNCYRRYRSFEDRKYRVNTETAIKIRDAHRLAIKFFQESKTTKTAAAAASNEEILINRYQRIVNGNLHGYNALPSKEIFRTWYKYDSDNYEEEQQQQKYNMYERRKHW